ncbi:aminoglycoside phosphotransferase family protein [Rhodocytophaga aerolata]|uniref:Aminoglycoside phosphotransferase family protein n=1 Tax=Rhodocytophaga aerolata TaxID=455078 RepID=A0ABT8R005_9BACT|nr:aminoglycoside phosphotransferase family protein [Rhodocytophaga aerolata]MDO1445426.1 aminoglycoside phosphotransferase family protein [Rhodocytophaga aerolata]
MTPVNYSAAHIQSIVSQFIIEGNVASVKAHGTGHIHDTFHVVNSTPQQPDYLLQRINHHVFKNIAGLTENIQLVTTHLRKKLEKIPGAAPSQEVLTLIPTKTGQGYYQDESGHYWRIFLFLPGTRSYDVVENAQQAYEGGRGFGKFLALLSDLDATLVHETIPHFHDVESRLSLFNKAISRNPKDRVKEVAAEISFVQERIQKMCTILHMGQRGVLPLRITHNDTKFNNVLLNANDQAQCVIDLDTVMPGYAAYDFGDAIRTIVNTAPEDEEDLSKIAVNMSLFEGFTRGFLSETRPILTANEVDSLAMGALLLPFIMGLRFLTDYIDGDTYYKIHYPEHNIIRARAQFSLVAKLEEQYPLMQQLIQTIASTETQLTAGK